MKPLIIYIDSGRDEIKLSRKQFERFIQDAYQQGYDSGYQIGYRSNHYWPYWTSGTITTTNTSNPQPPTITYTTGTDPNTFKPSVTCAPYEPHDGEVTLSNQNLQTMGEVHNTIGD